MANRLGLRFGSLLQQVAHWITLQCAGRAALLLIVALLLAAASALGQTTGGGQPGTPGGSSITPAAIASAVRCNDTSITANSITCATSPALTSYAAGLLLLTTIANTDTGATTINAGGGSVNVTASLANHLALSGGEMAAGSTYLLYYDGTQFVMLNDYAWVDASTYPGATADAQIANAITAGCGARSVIIDARNLISATLAANPFNSILGNGYHPTCTGILLLPSGVVTVNTPLVIPGGWRVIGVGASLTDNSTNSTQVTASATNFLGPYSIGTASMTSITGGSSSTYIATITGVSTNWTIGTNINYGEHFTQCTALVTGTTCGGTPATNPFDGIICGPPTPGCSAATTTSLTVITNNNWTTNTASSYVITSAVVEMGDESGTANQPGNFDVGIGPFTIQTNQVTGVNGLNNVSCQNLCHFLDSIFIHPAPSGIGFALMNPNMQNSGPYYPLWIVGEAGGCNTATMAAVVRGFTSVPINIDNWSAFTTNCGAVTTTIAVDAPVGINNWHIGGSNTTATGITVDVGDAVTCPQICYDKAYTTSGGSITNINLSGKGVTGLKHGNSSSPHDWSVSGVKDSSNGNYVNLFIDSVRSCTIPIATPYLAYYAIGDSSGTYLSLSEYPGCGGIGIAGTAPASVSTAGTAGVNSFALANMAGGPTTGSATTAGAGASSTLALGGAGGSGAGGTNAVGGAGGNATVSAGAGGASSGTAANANGGAVILTPGVAGTGGSGTAGVAGYLNINAVSGTCGQPLVVFGNTSTTTGLSTTGSGIWTWSSTGTCIMRWTGSQLELLSSALFGWGSGAPTTPLDTGLSRDAAAVVDCGNGTASNKACVFQSKRYTVDGGTTLVSGSFTLSAGWGTTASLAITDATSKDAAAVVTVTSSGTGQAANPTLLLTFTDGTWTNIPACIAIQSGGTGIFGDSTTTTRSATAQTWQWNATPTAAATYEFTIHCTGT